MKHFLIILTSLILSLHLNAQNEQIDLSKFSIEKLKEMKKEAVSNSQFLLADKITKEIALRKPTSEIKAELEKQMKTAVAKEDYKKAGILKEKIGLAEKVIKLEKKIDSVLIIEDFVLAQKFSEEKKLLIAQINDKEIITQEEKKTVKKAKSGKVNILFEKLKYRDIYGVDILIDDIYYGYTNNETGLIVENLPIGKHKITLVINPIFKNGVPTRKFDYEEDFSDASDYHIVFTFSNINEKLRLEKTYRKLSESEKANAKKVYNINKTNDLDTNSIIVQNHEKLIFPKPSKNEAIRTYFDFKTFLTSYKSLDDNSIKSFNFNLGFNLTRPLKNSGFIFGYGFHFYTSSYQITSRLTEGVIFYDSGNDFTSEKDFISKYRYNTISLNAIFGYQLEFTDQISVHSYLALTPSFNENYSYVAVPEISSSSFSTSFLVNYDETSEWKLGFGGYWGTTAFLMFNKRQSFGVSLGMAVGFTGGVGVSVGLATSGLMTKYRHRLYNKVL